MAQKFTSLEDAAKQLSISKDRLNQLREAGKVRAYRDGASWKFRSEDIDKLEADGIPQIDPGGSDLSLDTVDDLESSHDELEMGPASDISLEDVDEPTVAGMDEGSDDALALDDDSIDINKDSILLSDAELGSVIRRPPSTIIGKAELDLDADLDLSPLDKGAPKSDAKSAGDSGSLLAGEDISLDLPSPSGNFEGLEELEVDLEAESSRILSPEDVAKAQAAARSSDKKEKKQPSSIAGLSDLGLAPIDSDVAVGGSDVNLGSAASGVGLSGLSALELDDDDEVLGEGSDVTLSGESSGINIISPSDSGLALDEVPLDLSGSAPIGSSLDLGSISSDDMSLEPLGGSGPESKIGEDFQLTPLGEEDADEEKDSSQVIALDELSEESAAHAPLPSGLGEHGMMSEDFALGGLTPGAAPVAAATAVDMPFSLWNVLGLSSCMVLLGLCGMMTFDLLRNMWSWNEVSTINSWLLEVLNPFLGR